MDDEAHNDEHLLAENAVIAVLEQAFPYEPSCRLAVLLQLVAEDLESITDAEEVRDAIRFLSDVIIKRTMNDFALFNTVGSA